MKLGGTSLRGEFYEPRRAWLQADRPTPNYELNSRRHAHRLKLWDMPPRPATPFAKPQSVPPDRKASERAAQRRYTSGTRLC